MKIKLSILLALVCPMLLNACAKRNQPSAKVLKRSIISLEFEQLSLPMNRKEQSKIRLSPSVQVYFNDNTNEKWPLNYRPLFKAGDQIGSKTIGQLFDHRNRAIYKNGQPVIANEIDGLSLLTHHKLPFLVTHFEYNAPGMLYTTALKENGGIITPTSTQAVDLSSVNGTMINCASSVTPWNTHFSSEEDYYLDAASFDPETSDLIYHIEHCDEDLSHLKDDDEQLELCWSYHRLRDDYLKDNKEKTFTPYDYGYVFEVEVSAQGSGKAFKDQKHYAMGKGTPEMALVMPDNKTVYITDDGTFKGFYLFIADTAGDLSKGTLYMARWIQISAQRGGKASLKWIRLGHGDDASIQQLIRRQPKFSDIFERADPSQCEQKQNGFRWVRAGDLNNICLKLQHPEKTSIFNSQKEIKQAAAFLEPRKYGNYLGATAEFRKAEGITYDPDRNKLYLAMSELNKSMLNNYKNEPESLNHIQLERNDCGAIYEMSFTKAIDQNQDPIPSSFVATALSPLVTGQPLKPNQPFSDENGCNPDKMANPDNIYYLGYNLLLIAEDSGYKFNNSVMVFNTKSKQTTRILTAPFGAEVAGSFANGMLNNKQFLFLSIQHPFKDKVKNALGKKVHKKWDNEASKADKLSQVGYIEGLPPFKPKDY